MHKPYRDYSDFLAQLFQGKVQKLALNAGFTCPNRDGSKGQGGCSYCNNHSFNPAYAASAEDIATQIARGRNFFGNKYPEMRYLAYFQAYTNTYDDIARLRALYEEALAPDDVVGLIIGTRPDCMPDELLEILVEIDRRKRVIVEFGVESAHNETLQFVNRCHTWEEACDAITRTSGAGLSIGAHLIMGLPGETEDMMLETVEKICALPVDTLKFHHLQILKGTRMAAEADKIRVFTLEEYLDLCVRIISLVPGHIAIERFVSSAPPDMVIAPKWGLKNYQFTHLLLNRLRQKDQ